MQGRERVIRIDIGQVGHALLFDQIALAGQHFEQARDDLVEQAMQLSAGGRTRLLEDRFAPGAPIHAVEHQAMQMNVQVGGRAESLDEGDRAGVGCGAFQVCLLEQKPRDDAGWMMRSASVRSSGCAANRTRNGIGSDSTHCRTGTRGITSSTRPDFDTSEAQF